MYGVPNGSNGSPFLPNCTYFIRHLPFHQLLSSHRRHLLCSCLVYFGFCSLDRVKRMHLLSRRWNVASSIAISTANAKISTILQFHQFRRLRLGYLYFLRVPNVRRRFCSVPLGQLFTKTDHFVKYSCVGTSFNNRNLTSSRKESIVIYHPYPHNPNTSFFIHITHLNHHLPFYK